MSASLVGSEMCIRDRRSCCPPTPVALPRGVGLPPPHSPIGSSGGPAVSYTHLTLPTICSV
eukprot:7509938-Alexandrium_andersonii.AAC.1